MKIKITLLSVGIGIGIAIGIFLFRPTEKPFDASTFKDLVVKAMHQRSEADFVPDIIIDDFPASAWLFAKKYEYNITDIPLGWDFTLEIAEKKEGKEGTIAIYSGDKLYELPFPDRLVSRVHYSFYTMCPMEVSLYYTEKKKLTEWASVFKDISVVAGSMDGRELYGAKDNVRIKYTVEDEDATQVEITFFSKHRGKIKFVKKEVMDALYSLDAIQAGDWLLRSQWNVPNEWIDSRINFEEISRVYLTDFSWSLSAPLLRGEIVLWNGCFIEGVLYFTYDNWLKVQNIVDWFNIPEVQFSSRRDGDIVEVQISDVLMKDIFSYLQLLDSGFYGKIRETYLERMEKK